MFTNICNTLTKLSPTFTKFYSLRSIFNNFYHFSLTFYQLSTNSNVSSENICGWNLPPYFITQVINILTVFKVISSRNLSSVSINIWVSSNLSMSVSSSLIYVILYLVYCHQLYFFLFHILQYLLPMNICSKINDHILKVFLIYYFFFLLLLLNYENNSHRDFLTLILSLIFILHMSTIIQCRIF